MWRHGHRKKDGGLSLYFHTCFLKYSPVGAWLVHIWVSWEKCLRLMSLNHFGGCRQAISKRALCFFSKKSEKKWKKAKISENKWNKWVISE